MLFNPPNSPILSNKPKIVSVIHECERGRIIDFLFKFAEHSRNINYFSIYLHNNLFHFSYWQWWDSISQPLILTVFVTSNYSAMIIVAPLSFLVWEPRGIWHGRWYLPQPVCAHPSKPRPSASVFSYFRSGLWWAAQQRVKMLCLKCWCLVEVPQSGPCWLLEPEKDSGSREWTILHRVHWDGQSTPWPPGWSTSPLQVLIGSCRARQLLELEPQSLHYNAIIRRDTIINKYTGLITAKIMYLHTQHKKSRTGL